MCQSPFSCRQPPCSLQLWGLPVLLSSYLHLFVASQLAVKQQFHAQWQTITAVSDPCPLHWPCFYFQRAVCTLQPAFHLPRAAQTVDFFPPCRVAFTSLLLAAESAWVGSGSTTRKFFLLFQSCI